MKKAKILVVLLVISLFIIVYITSFRASLFNEKLHKKEFLKNNVYDVFPKADEINSEVLSYLRKDIDKISFDIFNEKEVNHLKDVKGVVQKGVITYYVVLIVFIVLIIGLYFIDKNKFLENIKHIFLFSGMSIILVNLLLLVWILFDFNSLFNLFHSLFFIEGSWIFKSSDNIVRLYPYGFFYDIGKKIFTGIFVYGIILIIVGFFSIDKIKFIAKYLKNKI